MQKTSQHDHTINRGTHIQQCVDDREMKLIPDFNFQKVFKRTPSFSFLLQEITTRTITATCNTASTSRCLAVKQYFKMDKTGKQQTQTARKVNHKKIFTHLQKKIVLKNDYSHQNSTILHCSAKSFAFLRQNWS